MNLLMFTQKLDREASVQGFAHEWVRKLADHVDELIVIANEVGLYDLPDSVAVHSLGAENDRGRLKKLYRLWSYLTETLNTHRIDGAFVHQIEHYGLASWFHLRWHEVPIVQFKAHKGVPVTLGAASYLFDYFVTSSEDGLELETDRKRVIGQGINTDRFRPTNESADSETFRLSTIGRISPVKDYETLLEALAKYQRDNGPLSVRIIGGPGTPDQRQYHQKLKQMAVELGIEDVVEFVPPVPNEEVVSEYRRSDLFVNLSRTGSLDKAVLEAMACECPIVTSNWAYREVLPESLQERCMIEPGDVDSLVDKIKFFRSIQGTSQERDLTGQLRKIVVEEHNLDRFMERLVEVFRELKTD